MGLAVVTVVAGGLPVVEALFGTPVTEAANGYGVPVTKVVGKPGMPVVFETIGMAPGFATLDGAVSNTTLSGDKLTATHSNTTTNSGARSTATKTAGKYYFEAKYNTTPLGGDPVGIMQPGATFANLVGGSAVVSITFGSGIAYTNGGQYGPVALGTIVAGDVVSFAVDLTNGKIWSRRNAGQWQGTGNGDPVAGTVSGVLANPANGYAPAVGFTTGGSGNNVTLNLGASAFIGAVPAGFTPGWPA